MSTSWVRRVVLLSLLAVACVAGVAVAGGGIKQICASGCLPGVDCHGCLDWENEGRQKYTGLYHCVSGKLVCLGKGNVQNKSCRHQCYNNCGLGEWVLEDCGYEGTTCVEKYIVQSVTAAKKRQHCYWACDTYCGGFKACSPCGDKNPS